MNSILSFREIYFNCNFTSLFEQVLKEASPKPDIFNIYDEDEPIKNNEPLSDEEAYEKYKNSPAYGSTNPTISRSDPETGKPFYQNHPELRTKDDQNIFYNSVKQYEPEEIENAQEVHDQDILKNMKTSDNPETLIAYLRKVNPAMLDKLSDYLLSINKKNTP